MLALPLARFEVIRATARNLVSPGLHTSLALG